MSLPSHIEQLRRHLAFDPGGRRRLLSVPGCWDAFSALLIEKAGFEAIFLSGGAVSAARLGRPDIGLVTATEMIETIALVRDRCDLPLLVDGDTGYGNVDNVARTVRNFERGGASAIQIEDQTFPKRCGHMAGKTIVSLQEAVDRISSALDARQHMAVIARTDALSLEGFDAAIDRAQAYLEAGADLIFVEGPRTMDELAGIGSRFGAAVPLVHNLVEGGITPTDSGDILERHGFAIALHPLLLIHGLAISGPKWLAALGRDRSTTALRAELADLSILNQILGSSGQAGKTE